MQTFMPYPNFRKSLECLDRQRLGKQRVEALQILNALSGETQGWSNHPATHMWRGAEFALVDYALTACWVWKERGYNDTCTDKIHVIRATQIEIWHYGDQGRWHFNQPYWLGNLRFHRSHRSNLLRKDPSHYGKVNWNVPDNLPYVWPGPTGLDGRAISAKPATDGSVQTASTSERK